jgi:2-phospho-L-lactate guanylyltransferase
MPTLVVPFRGAEGKSRLGLATAGARVALAEAMLADVVAACTAVGTTYVVAPGVEPPGRTVRVVDHGRGQGLAVREALDAAAADASGPFLIVNADLPCITPTDLRALARAVPDGGLALAPAADGTTNALGLASAALFAPLYGPGSAARFAGLALSRVLAAPNLVDDVDTVADLERVERRLGGHTRSVLASLRSEAAA